MLDRDIMVIIDDYKLFGDCTTDKRLSCYWFKHNDCTCKFSNCAMKDGLI